MDPGPVLLRMINFSASPIGDWLYVVRKRLVFPLSFMFSTFAMLRFTLSTVRGGGTDLYLIRARKGSPAATGDFDGMAPSSA